MIFFANRKLFTYTQNKHELWSLLAWPLDQLHFFRVTAAAASLHQEPIHGATDRHIFGIKFRKTVCGTCHQLCCSLQSFRLWVKRSKFGSRSSQQAQSILRGFTPGTYIKNGLIFKCHAAQEGKTKLAWCLLSARCVIILTEALCVWLTSLHKLVSVKLEVWTWWLGSRSGGLQLPSIFLQPQLSFCAFWFLNASPFSCSYFQKLIEVHRSSSHVAHLHIPCHQSCGN